MTNTFTEAATPPDETKTSTTTVDANGFDSETSTGTTVDVNGLDTETSTATLELGQRTFVTSNYKRLYMTNENMESR